MVAMVTFFCPDWLVTHPPAALSRVESYWRPQEMWPWHSFHLVFSVAKHHGLSCPQTCQRFLFSGGTSHMETCVHHFLEIMIKRCHWQRIVSLAMSISLDWWMARSTLEPAVALAIVGRPPCCFDTGYELGGYFCEPMGPQNHPFVIGNPSFFGVPYFKQHPCVIAEETPWLTVSSGVEFSNGTKLDLQKSIGCWSAGIHPQATNGW